MISQDLLVAPEVKMDPVAVRLEAGRLAGAEWASA